MVQGGGWTVSGNAVSAALGTRWPRLLVRTESREAFRAALGESDCVATATVRHGHDPAVTDTVVGLYCADLTAIMR